jgi:hypothetical protein
MESINSVLLDTRENEELSSLSLINYEALFNNQVTTIRKYVYLGFVPKQKESLQSLFEEITQYDFPFSHKRLFLNEFVLMIAEQKYTGDWKKTVSYF